MGNKASLTDKAIKYFREIKSATTIINDKQLKEQVQLSFSLEKCTNGSVYSIKIYSANDKLLGDSEEAKCDSTSLITEFNMTIMMTYYFESEQKLKLIINKDGRNIPFDVTLGNIVGSKKGTFSKQLQSETETIVITATELKVDNSYKLKVHFEMSTGVDYRRMRHKYYYILQAKKSLYQSELLSDQGTLNDVVIPLSLISPEFQIQFYDQYKKPATLTTFTYERFLSEECATIPITIGTIPLQVLNKSIKTLSSTFIDYLKGGCQIALTIGIDFTGSNGSPSSPSCLHYIGNPDFNNYERAIRQCGDILAYYDYDQLYPVYGFGAVMNNNQLNQSTMCFNINFTADPNIHTIDGVLGAYRNCVPQLTFYGPTNFAPLITQFLQNVKNDQPHIYHILMILTDGAISDTQNTIDAIIECTHYPISIIIIGIGNADFGTMNILDADDNPLKDSKGNISKRDIVQFVPFNNYKNDPQKLAAAVLEEIPQQMVEYYQSKNIEPGKFE